MSIEEHIEAAWSEHYSSLDKATINRIRMHLDKGMKTTTVLQKHIQLKWQTILSLIGVLYPYTYKSNTYVS